MSNSRTGGAVVQNQTNSYCSCRSVAFLAVVVAVLLRCGVLYANDEATAFGVQLHQQMASERLAAGKVFVITGGNSGLGYHTALHLAAEGAIIVLAARNAAKGAAAKAELVAALGTKTAVIDVMTLNLGSFDSIRAFTQQVKDKYSAIDVLINNAGIMAIPTRETTIDGLESQIGTNHFGHFLLTSLLMPLIKKTGRIINHSSSAHAFAAADWVANDLESRQSYSAWKAYGNSKAANLMFTYELNRRLRASGSSIISVAVHPGYTGTNLQAGRLPFWETANNLFAMTGEMGALSQFHAAVAPAVQPSHNDYIGPRFLTLGAPRTYATDAATWNATTQAALWSASCTMTGAVWSI